jgi:hypothetical protein
MIHCIENQRNVVALQKNWWRLLKYPNVAKIAWYFMEHIHEDGTPTHEHLIQIQCHVSSSKLHAFLSILRNGLRKYWIRV